MHTCIHIYTDSTCIECKQKCMHTYIHTQLRSIWAHTVITKATHFKDKAASSTWFIVPHRREHFNAFCRPLMRVLIILRLMRLIAKLFHLHRLVHVCEVSKPVKKSSFFFKPKPVKSASKWFSLVKSPSKMFLCDLIGYLAPTCSKVQCVVAPGYHVIMPKFTKREVENSLSFIKFMVSFAQHLFLI